MFPEGRGRAAPLAAADAVRALRRRVPRAADDGGEAPSSRPPGGHRGVPRARGRRPRRAEAVAGRAGARAPRMRRQPSDERDALREPERNGSCRSRPRVAGAAPLRRSRAALSPVSGGEVVLGDLQLARAPWWRTRRTPVPERFTARSARSSRQRRRIDRRAVGEARGEARRRGLLRARNAELVRERAHLVLADPGLEQRMDDTVLARGPQARPPVSEVVGVRARQDGGVAARAASAASRS